MRAISGKLSSIYLTVLTGMVMAAMGVQFMSGALLGTSGQSAAADGVRVSVQGSLTTPDDDQWG